MWKTTLFLCFCLLVYVSANSQEKLDDVEWNDDGWYDEELEDLGIIDQEQQAVEDQKEPGDDQIVEQTEEKLIEEPNLEEIDENSKESLDGNDENKDYESLIYDYDEKADENLDGYAMEAAVDPANDDEIINDQQLFDDAEEVVDDVASAENSKISIETGVGEDDITIDKKEEEIADDQVLNDSSKKTADAVDIEAKNNNDLSDNEDLKVEEEINQFLNKEKSIKNENEEFDGNDYQVEDNRSDVQDKSDVESNKNDQKSEDKEVAKDFNEQIFEETKNLLDAVNSEMIIDEDENLSKEKTSLNKNDKSNSILSEEQSKESTELTQLDDEIKKNDNIDESANIDKVDEENLNKEIKYVGKDQADTSDNVESLDEDTVAEALDAVKSDIDQLVETFNKLTENDDSPGETEDKIEDENVLDYEDKYERPFREGNVLQVRDDYDEAGTHDSSEDKHHDYDNDPEDNNGDEIKYDDIENKDGAMNDDIGEDMDSLIALNRDNEPKKYINDALQKDNEAEKNLNIDAVEVNIDIETNGSEKLIEQADKEISSELSDLILQFKEDHSEDLDTQAVNFDKNVAPVFINLKVDEPVEITSPNYPGAYPTNNIIDWVIDGEGMGIEMNVTDLGLNGILGDYLLVKPGGVDASGSDGLVFSYRLKSVRKYRFLNVNKMFIRFEAKPGMSLPANQGFSLTVKLIAPWPRILEPAPEPQPVVDPPEHQIEVYLAGLSPQQFIVAKEEFRQIIADMATMYINYQLLDIGDTTTDKVTQITQVSTCNINWHGFEQCAGVTFGVPLGNENKELNSDQLEDMWWKYRDVDPFDARLKRMGVSDFAMPNDEVTLMVWLLIGFGVIFSVSMLALALWRWSCREDYTRMPSHSDTDSVLGDYKRGLDLYPHPHQTIPPLYDDNFIKYEDTARVDMGGLANRSFTQDVDLYDMDSDDDVIGVNKSRSGKIQPKDIYPI